MDKPEVDQHAPHTTTQPPPPAPPAPPTRHAGSWLGRLLAEPSVQLTLIAWLAANLAVVLLARGHLPFHRPTLHARPYLTQLLSPNLAMLGVLGLIAVTFALTRKRVIPDIAARAPKRVIAAQETVALVGYGIVGLLGGWILGTALGFHPISFHLAGTLYGSTAPVSRAEVGVWATWACGRWRWASR